MTEQRLPLERMIAGWMADEAAGAPEPLLERVLETTARTAPRPRWWAQLAERPMRSRAMRTAVGLPNRALVFVALLALLLAALAAIAAGAGLFEQRGDQTGDWPGFRGGADRTGVALAGPAGNPVVMWQFHAAGAVLEVAVVGDTAFFASDDGSLYAISREGGNPRWKTAVSDPPLTGPYAADGRLYVSDRTGTFHAFRQDDGRQVWTSAVGYAGPSRAISVEGSVYFGTSDGLVVALDAATGAERWRIQPAGATHVDAPAFADGRLYAGTDGAGFVAIDTASRRVIWTGDTNDEDTGSATVADGIAYIGAGAEVAAAGTLRAFDAATGTPLWTASQPSLALPAVADGIAYSTSIRGLIVAIDTKTGSTLWTDRLAGDVRSPVLVDGVIFVTAGVEHRIYAIEAATGNELWHLDIDAYANCCVTVAKGRVFVGTQTGSVYAIGGDGRTVAAAPLPSLAPRASASAVASGTPTPALIPQTIAWSTDLRGKGFAPICQIAVDPSGRIWAPEADTGKIAVIAPDGGLLEEWGAPGSDPGQFDFTRGNGDCYGMLAFARDGSFFVLDVGNRRVQAFDKNRTLVRTWGSIGTQAGQYTDPVAIAVAGDGTLWVVDDVRAIAEHYEPTGNVIGSFDPFSNAPINQGANSMAIGPNGHLYISQIQPNQIAEFDAHGTFLRAYGVAQFPAEQPTQMAVDADGRVFVTQGPGRGSLPGVTVFDAAGSVLGGFGPVGTGDGELSFPAGIALDSQGSVYVMDSESASARLMKIELKPPFAP